MKVSKYTEIEVIGKDDHGARIGGAPVEFLRYRGRYRLFQFYPVKPSSVAGWMRLIWGADVWLWHVPLLKLTLALSVALSLLVGWLIG
jgi:hypothetical protein